MTVIETSGISSVQARIAEIQSQVDALNPAPVHSTNGSDFASTLQRVTASSVGTGTNATGQQAVDLAQQYLGVPYVYGGSDPKTGLDCSGLVQVVYREMGIELPRTTYDQVKLGTAVDRADLRPGDLVFSVGDKGNQVNGHVGIYAGNGRYIVAPHTGDVVKIANLPDNITAIRRIIPGGTGLGGTTGASSSLASGALASALSSSLGGTNGSSTNLDSLLTSALGKYGSSPTQLAEAVQLKAANSIGVADPSSLSGNAASSSPLGGLA